MRFLADMGISPRSVAFLRDRGVEAVHLNELGLDRMPDAEVVKKARREGYVVLTHDLDFAELPSPILQLKRRFVIKHLVQAPVGAALDSLT